MYTLHGADHLAGNETIILAKPLTLEVVSLRTNGNPWPEGVRRWLTGIMTKSDMAQLEADLTQET